ncbi:MAG: DUF1588 domain-containing protein [Archangiaceae bacterium]|nr:DUF1588 domain-containing protein [Archangiaceae bacterium]
MARSLVIAALLSVACDGSIIAATPGASAGPPGSTPPMVGGTGGSGSETGSGGSGTGGGATNCESAVPPARLWRLSHAQYDLTVQALLGTTDAPAESFELQAAGSGFQNGADTSYVSANLAQQYFAAAEGLAAAAMRAPAKVLPCTPASPADTACVKRFIDAFGRQVFREPLDAARAATYFSLYQSASTPARGVELVIAAMLQSPYFLYRRELGAPAAHGATVPLTSYELASALSFLLWDQGPDDALLDAAARDAVPGEVERLLADPRAKGFAWRFFSQDFELDRISHLTKDVTVFPAFTDALQADLSAEAEAFVNHVTWSSTGTLSELLTADYSLLNARLGALYGVTVSGSAFTKTALPSGQRSGLLTQAGLLAVHGDDRSGSPVQRGLFVRSNLLCQEMPAPPPNVADTLELPGAVKTTRQRYEAHLQNPTCSACHKLMDPIGFGFENFDGIGRWRTTENGVAVDVRGNLSTTKTIDGPFTGAVELGQRLASAPEVSDCVATGWFRYALGRVETHGDGCSLATVRAKFKDSGTRLSELVRSIISTPAFNQRVKP